jgi:hypothetical protein
MRRAVETTRSHHDQLVETIEGAFLKLGWRRGSVRHPGFHPDLVLVDPDGGMVVFEVKAGLNASAFGSVAQAETYRDALSSVMLGSVNAVAVVDADAPDQLDDVARAARVELMRLNTADLAAVPLAVQRFATAFDRAPTQPASQSRLATVVTKTIGVRTVDAAGRQRGFVLLPAGEELPRSSEATFATAVENQVEVEVTLYEWDGEPSDDEPDIAFGVELANLTLVLPQPMPKGTPVSVRILANAQGRISAAASVGGVSGAIEVHLHGGTTVPVTHMLR